MTDVRNERDIALGRIVLHVAVPLVIAAVAYGLSWLSDQLLYIGPFDRAAFGWTVVIPLWLAAGPAAALAWRGLTLTERSVAAAVVAVVIGGVAGFLYWLSVAFPACETVARFTPAERVLPSLILGAVVGGAPAIGGLAGSYIDGARPWNVALRGAAAGFAINVIAFAALVTFLSESACQRPQV